MKLDIVVSQNKAKAPKTPAEAFKNCPRCGCKELIQIETDVLCGRCPWDSCKAAVDGGLMDKMFTRSFRCFDHDQEENSNEAAQINIQAAESA